MSFRTNPLERCMFHMPSRMALPRWTRSVSSTVALDKYLADFDLPISVSYAENKSVGRRHNMSNVPASGSVSDVAEMPKLVKPDSVGCHHKHHHQHPCSSIPSRHYHHHMPLLEPICFMGEKSPYPLETADGSVGGVNCRTHGRCDEKLVEYTPSGKVEVPKAEPEDPKQLPKEKLPTRFPSSGGAASSSLVGVPALEVIGGNCSCNAGLGQKYRASPDMTVFESLIKDISVFPDPGEIHGIDLSKPAVVFAYRDSAFYTPFKRHGKKMTIGNLLITVRHKGGKKYLLMMQRLVSLMFARFPADCTPKVDILTYMLERKRKTLTLQGMDNTQTFLLTIKQDDKLYIQKSTGGYTRAKLHSPHYWHKTYPNLFIIEVDKPFAMI